MKTCLILNGKLRLLKFLEMRLFVSENKTIHCVFRQAIHAPRERITDYGANFSNLPLLLRTQYKLQKKYQPYVTQNLLNVYFS